jgi:hypothetical protein
MKFVIAILLILAVVVIVIIKSAPSQLNDVGHRKREADGYQSGAAQKTWKSLLRQHHQT